MRLMYIGECKIGTLSRYLLIQTMSIGLHCTSILIEILYMRLYFQSVGGPVLCVDCGPVLCVDCGPVLCVDCGSVLCVECGQVLLC